MLSPPRCVTQETLNVSPDLIGRPLAPPGRRAAAMALDLVLVALLTGTHNVWLAAGLLGVAWQLRRESLAHARGVRAAAVWALVAVFAVLAGHEAWQALQPREARPVRAAAGPGDDPDGDVEQAPAAVAAQAIGQAADGLRAEGLPRAAEAMTAAASALGASMPAPTPADQQVRLLRQRVEQLESELAEARRPRKLRVDRELRRGLDALGASFGWAVVYFSLLPAFWNGQTLGKRLFGLRVVELTGQPMTVMRCLRRYGGYAAGMATGGLGFAQALWDVNRQGLQDRAAHTAVIDVRPAPAAAPDLRRE